MKNQSQTLSDIMTRTSIRAYDNREVTDETLEILLRAAMAAPSSGNKQPWRFVVIRDKATLEFISSHFPTMYMMDRAKVAIVVCGDMKATFPEDGRDYWIQDTSAATENLLLAAHTLGLGAVWCGVYPQMDRVKIFSDLLNLPSDIVPLNCIAIGYPSHPGKAKNKWNPEFIHNEKW